MDIISLICGISALILNLPFFIKCIVLGYAETLESNLGIVIMIMPIILNIIGLIFSSTKNKEKMCLEKISRILIGIDIIITIAIFILYTII